MYACLIKPFCFDRPRVFPYEILKIQFLSIKKDKIFQFNIIFLSIC